MVVVSTAAVSVPARMALSQVLRSSLPDLYDAKLIPVSIQFGSVSEKADDTVTLQEAAQLASSKTTGTTASISTDSPSSTCQASIAFVIRRPGCGLCREHGLQLTEFANKQQLSKGNNQIQFWGIIRETGVDDAGLAEFYEKYYRFPLYRDADLKIYEGMGNRRIGLGTWNPFRIWKGFKEVSNRLQQKEITTNMKGYGLIQGGVLIFDKDGVLRYAYEEDTGNEFEMDDIAAAVEAVCMAGEAQVEL